MEDEIKVEEYIRTKDGILFKTTEYWVEEYEKEPEIHTNIKKHSPNIIDLIEVNDYVNGEQITDIWNGDRVSSIKSNFNEEDIKSIVTHEQFKSIEYTIHEREEKENE